MRAIALSIGLTLGACQGLIGEPGNGPTGAINPAAPSNPTGPTGASGPPTGATGPATQVDPCASGVRPGPAPMRRLSNTEYRYTVTDLLGPAQADRVARLAGQFTSETESLGFRNSAEFLEVSPVGAQKYMDAAEELAPAVGRSLLPCDPGADGEATCAQAFILAFGKRAFRRPLTADEVQRYTTLYAAAAASYDFDTGIEWILFSMLQSPALLNRAELAATKSGASYAQVGPYEMASRLSYLLWLSMPDDALFEAAERGKLSTPEELEAQARRMLADPKARRVLSFFDEWLDTDEIPAAQRDPARFPEATPELRASLRAETEAFAKHVVFEANGSLELLLTAPFTFVDARLAEHYGLPVPAGSGFSKVDLDPTKHAGIFTQGGPLTAHDRATRTSIVRRGLKIRTDFLCQNIGAPPNNVNFNLPEVGEGLSQIDRLAQHREDPACASCHILMDPIGVSFENFDALGRFRTHDEGGKAIDPTSQLELTRDANGPIASAAELAQRLAASQQVRSCFTTQLFRYAFGRIETAADACSKHQLDTRFDASGHRLNEALVALTQIDAFRFRPAEAP